MDQYGLTNGSYRVGLADDGRALMDPFTVIAGEPPAAAGQAENVPRSAGQRCSEAGDDDLREAHSLHLSAVESTRPEHPEYATVLSNLASSFRDHYVQFNRHTDLLAAIEWCDRTV